MENKIVLEVGVSNGYHTGQLRKKYNLPVYGFEPVPHLQKMLTEKFKNDPDVHIFEAAVDIEDGEKLFHISDPNGMTDRGPVHPYGCSSLFQFNKNIHKKWPNRPDFKAVETILVKTVNLENFLNSHNFKGEIRYLHCDAQGNDLNVLKSLGKYLQNVKQGVIEVAWRTELYENTENTFYDAYKFLNENNFDVTIPDPSYSKHEVNCYFINKKMK